MKSSLKIIVIAVVLLCLHKVSGADSECHKAIYAAFKLGNEVLLDEKLGELKDKNIAVLTNQTGITSDGTHIIDALVAKGIKVVKIFTPEHGIRGDESYTDIDEKTGIPIISLYNGKYAPSASDLSDVDILIYDIQDVGARFYTYSSTLYYVIASCEQSGKKLIVCDRPMIVNPAYTDGFLLESGNESFVGLVPTPICYGMTSGELASFLEMEVYGVASTVEVVRMLNYTRATEFTSLKLKWVKPSPSMYFPSTAVCYGSTCFLEGTNVSEGRGTEKPFEYFGAPWVNSEAISAELNSYNLRGVKFEPVNFTPSEKVSSYPPKFFGKECGGVFINVTDKSLFEPVKCGVAVLVSLNKLCPEFKFNKDNFIDKLAGTNKLRKMVTSGTDFGTIAQSWQNDLDSFIKIRSKYLLY